MCPLFVAKWPVVLFVLSLGFAAQSVMAGTVTWKGGASGDWSGADVWDPQAPVAGDDVIIENTSTTDAMAIMCSTATPELNSLTVTGNAKKTATLTMSGWNSKIQATMVTVNAYGVLSCADGGETEDSLSRVWIDCKDLTVAANGKVDVTGKGYNGTFSKKYDTGFGPGAGSGASAANGGGAKGASHGGYGGAFHGKRTLPYGNAETPTTAGSSGGIAHYAGSLIPGGGVVTVQASGTVTVNGSILASSPNTTKYGNTQANDNTAGSGGSILIDANVFKGLNGVLRADGGSSSCPTNFNTGRVGGGGRIAIKYNTSAQKTGFVSGMTISAAPGLYKWKVSGETTAFASCDNDTYRSEADLGTLWFTDDKMLESLGTGISGQLVNVSELTLDSLNMTSGHVRFAKDGVKVNIAGNLTISGENARLEIGGTVATNYNDFVSLYSAYPAKLSVGGKVTVQNRGRLDIRAAAVADVTTTVGASVNVTNAVEILTGGRIVAWSDCEAGGSPRFEVGSLKVDSTSQLTADAHGFAGGFALYQKDTIVHGDGFGPGRGRYYSSAQAVGGGHGGTGGGRLSQAYGGASYDDPYYPCQAGSGGGLNSPWMFKGGEGGGVIDVRAVGTIQIDGRVSANGVVGDGRGASTAGVGSGAGGTVFLFGRRVVSSEGSSILACGADAELTANKYYAAGGGGRISIWAGEGMTTEGVPESRITRSADPSAMPEGLKLKGTVSVAAGTDASAAPAVDGTMWFTHVATGDGFLIIVH